MTDQPPTPPGDQPSWPSGEPEPPAPPPPGPDAGTPPPPPPAAPASVPGAPADLGPRFLARLIDHILIGFAASIILLPFVAFGGGTGFGGLGIEAVFAGIFTVAAALAYFALMESSRGQTLGKMALSIRTVGPEGGNPTPEEVLRRNAWLALSIVPILGGLAQLGVAIWIAVTINGAPDRRGPHDGWAGGTQVVKA